MVTRVVAKVFRAVGGVLHVHRCVCVNAVSHTPNTGFRTNAFLFLFSAVILSATSLK